MLSIACNSWKQQDAQNGNLGRLAGFRPGSWWPFTAKYYKNRLAQTTFIYLSSEMLQSMTVDLLVLTTINGRRMIDPESGAPVSRSVLRLRSTRFLNAICCTDKMHAMATNGLTKFSDSHIMGQITITQRTVIY